MFDSLFWLEQKSFFIFRFTMHRQLLAINWLHSHITFSRRTMSSISAMSSSVLNLDFDQVCPSNSIDWSFRHRLRFGYCRRYGHRSAAIWYLWIGGRSGESSRRQFGMYYLTGIFLIFRFRRYPKKPIWRYDRVTSHSIIRRRSKSAH